MLAFAAAGCAHNPSRESGVAQDCSAQVRLGTRVYTGYGFTDRSASEFAVAVEADCHDVGADAEGSVFSEDPKQVTVWSFQGYAPEKVVGVHFDKDSLAVFVESVPRADVDRIVNELSQPPR